MLDTTNKETQGAADRSSAPSGRDLKSRENNFDHLRIFAAFLVLFSHSYFFTDTVVREPFFKYLGGYTTGGGWGVAIFFVISGFLIAKSIESRTIEEYLLSRFLRIVPGLLVVTLATVFLLGPVMTTLNLHNYFSEPGTWKYLWTASVFNIEYTLPGVFVETPAKAVNGSLWTLPVEATFYLLVPLAYVSGLLKARIVGLAAAVTIGAFLHMHHNLGYSYSNPGGVFSLGFLFYSGSKAAALFLAGAFFWICRRSIPMGQGIAIVMTILLLLCTVGIAKQLVFFIAVPYLVIYFGTSKKIRLPILDRMGDVSYGFYIYAMPVQQSIVYLLKVHDPIILTLISTPATLLLATLSWRFVEMPALSFKKRRKSENSAPSQPSS